MTKLNNCIPSIFTIFCMPRAFSEHSSLESIGSSASFCLTPAASIMKKPEARIEPYTHPAAGWGALKYVAINLLKEKVTGGNYRTLFKQNQPDGFDCPGCAWPDREHASTFEFCENGVKAVAAEATSKRVTPAFFAQHTRRRS